MTGREHQGPGPTYMELAVDFTFEASHVLPEAPPESKCARLHGHSWKVEVHVGGELDPERGWVVDFDRIKGACEPVWEALDHRHLNDLEGLHNPTSEMVAAWIWERLAPEVPGLLRITVHETCTARCTYFGPAVTGGADA